MTLNLITGRATRQLFAALSVLALFLFTGCGMTANYSFTGTSTPAKTISITEFYNNADLGPANMGQTLTNNLKTYFIQNSSISVVQQEGELQMEGEVSSFTLTPVAPVANTSDPNAITAASATRITITVKVTYVNTLDETMSFKDKSFSFYKDFDNSVTLGDVQESYTRDIFTRIINDIFNASVANW